MELSNLEEHKQEAERSLRPEHGTTSEEVEEERVELRKEESQDHDVDEDTGSD